MFLSDDASMVHGPAVDRRTMVAVMAGLTALPWRGADGGTPKAASNLPYQNGPDGGACDPWVLRASKRRSPRIHTCASV